MLLLFLNSISKPLFNSTSAILAVELSKLIFLFSFILESTILKIELFLKLKSLSTVNS